MDITLTSTAIRKILQNAGKIKKDCRCIYCNGTGWINYDEDGDNILPGYSSNLDRQSEECDECDGIGYNLNGYLDD